ncbi:MAG: SUMF1/EgtB/PvdO family nonheme iron enzyme [Chloroflexi bacterium]|nr:SUMF1/EgtB/PvdO family nonheme iron enzyme [Chloroflexota bacterium]
MADSKTGKDLGLSNEWRSSGAHLAFLCTFVEPRLPDEHPQIEGVTWHQVLGRRPEIIVERMRIAFRVIDVCDDVAAIDKQFTVKDLRAMLPDHVEGVSKLRKQELIDKIIEQRLLLQCTKRGMEIAESYAADPEAFIDEMWTESRLKAWLKWLLEAFATEIAIGTIIGNLLWNAGEKLLTPTELPPQPPTATPEPVPAPEPPATSTPTRPRLDIEWCRVPAGYFWMGEENYKRNPRQRKHLPAFSISKYPITNAQYEKFCRAASHDKPWHWEGGKIPAGKENHPVAHVSWHDAVAYCEWASRWLRPITLPTEEQWEKAARGTDGRKYPWGDDWRDNYCNTHETGIRDTTAVGAYSPRGDSPYGCVDMAGNVWEWTDSWYDDAQCRRVLRGGSWSSDQNAARAAYRDYYFPDYRVNFFGFRVVVVRRPPSQ